MQQQRRHARLASEPVELAEPESAENASFRSIPGDLGLGLLILCDHADNAIPKPYGTLGLDEGELSRHIAYDIGIGGVAERVAAALGAPAFLTRFSRLLIDPNRGTDDPTLIMQISDGMIVPGNAILDEAERENRIKRYYEPYHSAITKAIDAAMLRGKPPVLLSLHSFTPAWKSVPRPWHATVLWDKDPRFALPLLKELQRLQNIIADDNVPYTGKLRGDTLHQHGTQRGLAHALLELRQDLIMTEAQQAEWSGRLVTVLRRLLSDTRLAGELHNVKRYGSHTD